MTSPCSATRPHHTSPDLTDEDRAAWRGAEALIDELLTPADASLSRTQVEALIRGTDAIGAALGI